MSGWGEFSAAMALFMVSHMLPTRPQMRQPLTAVLGPRGFLFLYSLVSVALLYWLIAAAGRAPHITMWEYAPWQTLVPNLVMPIAILLVVLAIGAPNPLSFGGAHSERFDPDHPGLIGITRHPLLWALLLWSVAHMAPNGDLAHIVLFGTFGAFSLAGMVLIDCRHRRQMGAVMWSRLTQRTSFWPFAAMLGEQWYPYRTCPWLRIIAGAVAYGILLMLHPLVIGVSPLPAY